MRLHISSVIHRNMLLIRAVTRHGAANTSARWGQKYVPWARSDPPKKLIYLLLFIYYLSLSLKVTRQV